MKTRNKKCALCLAQKNASDQVTRGFAIASDWLRGWREINGPIIKRSKGEPMHYGNSIHTRLKIDLKSFFC